MSSDLRVVSLIYNPENTAERVADIYDPNTMDLHDVRGAVIKDLADRGLPASMENPSGNCSLHEG